MSEESANIETFPAAVDPASGLAAARKMPHNLPAEQNLLGALLIDNDIMEKIDDRLLQAYLRIRGGAKNGMAVVPIEREASAGSYIKIPPQRILDEVA